MTALINPSVLTDDEPRLGAVPFVDERPKRKKKARLAAAPKAPTVSLVVPALNEERNIAWVLERVPACVTEIILVDGFSSDRLFRFLNALGSDIEIAIKPRARSSKRPTIRVVKERLAG